MAVYTLPELDYDYDALEPHISAAIVTLHHDKHHAAYVAGANTALEKLAAARDAGDQTAINKLEKDLAFNLAGHINHSIYWKNLSPTGGGEPDGDLKAAIDQDFGSFEAFQKQLNESAKGIQGSGWAVLAYEPLSGKLLTLQVYDHQSNLPLGAVPLLMLDMWEHAFYLQYKNVKADYVDAYWHIINWADVAARLAAAKCSC